MSGNFQVHSQEILLFQSLKRLLGVKKNIILEVKLTNKFKNGNEKFLPLKASLQISEPHGYPRKKSQNHAPLEIVFFFFRQKCYFSSTKKEHFFQIKNVFDSKKRTSLAPLLDMNLFFFRVFV
jgi:hypothetical protein